MKFFLSSAEGEQAVFSLKAETETEAKELQNLVSYTKGGKKRIQISLIVKGHYSNSDSGVSLPHWVQLEV